jgi:hypothetical protein
MHVKISVVWASESDTTSLFLSLSRVGLENASLFCIWEGDQICSKNTSLNLLDSDILSWPIEFGTGSRRPNSWTRRELCWSLENLSVIFCECLLHQAIQFLQISKIQGANWAWFCSSILRISDQ